MRVFSAVLNMIICFWHKINCVELDSLHNCIIIKKVKFPRGDLMGQRFGILGVELNNPLDALQGVDMAPKAFRYANLYKILKDCSGYNGSVFDYGDVVLGEMERIQYYQIQRLDMNVFSNILKSIRDLTYKMTIQHQIPVVLGGDESLSLGTVEGLTMHYKKMGMICFDAHLKLGEEDVSGFEFIKKSMRALQFGRDSDKLVEHLRLKNYLSPDRLVYIGARDYSRSEILIAKEHRIKIYTIMDVEKMGITKIIDETTDYLADCDGVHLSFDFDCIDGEMLAAIGYPISMGLTPKEAMIAMNLLYQTGLITSSEFFGIDCCKDMNNQAGKIGTQLIGALFGAKSL